MMYEYCLMLRLAFGVTLITQFKTLYMMEESPAKSKIKLYVVKFSVLMMKKLILLPFS